MLHYRHVSTAGDMNVSTLCGYLLVRQVPLVASLVYVIDIVLTCESSVSCLVYIIDRCPYLRVEPVSSLQTSPSLESLLSRAQSARELSHDTLTLTQMSHDTLTLTQLSRDTHTLIQLSRDTHTLIQLSHDTLTLTQMSHDTLTLIQLSRDTHTLIQLSHDTH